MLRFFFIAHAILLPYPALLVRRPHSSTRRSRTSNPSLSIITRSTSTPAPVPPCHPRGLSPAHPHLARGSMAKDAVPPRLPSSETPDLSGSAVPAVVGNSSSQQFCKKTSPTQNEPHHPSQNQRAKPRTVFVLVSTVSRKRAVRVAVRSFLNSRQARWQGSQGKVNQPGSRQPGTCSRKQENDMRHNGHKRSWKGCGLTVKPLPRNRSLEPAAGSSVVLKGSCSAEYSNDH